MSSNKHNPNQDGQPHSYAVRRTLGLYWSSARRYRWWLLLHLVTVACAVLLQNTVVPLLLSRGVKLLPAYLAQPHPVFWTTFGGIIIAYVASQVGQWITWRFSGIAIVVLESRIERDLEQRVFAHLTTLSYRFFADTFGGALVAQSTRFVNAAERLYDTLTFEVMPLALKVVVSFIIICFFAPPIAFGLLAFCAIFIGSIVYLFQRKMPISRKAAAASTRLTAQLADNVTNMPAIKYFAHEADEIRRYNRTSQERFRLTVRDWTMQEYILGWEALLMTIFETLVFIASLNLVASHRIDLGQLVLIQAFVWNIFASLWSVGRIARNIERGLSDAAEMTTILHTEPEVQDAPAAAATTIKRGQVEFRHASFAYQEGSEQQAVFQDLNLTIAPGEKVGLVGPSGGGKTTITKLLLRLMDLTDGQILLDGHPVMAIPQADVRRAISYVPQEPLLFHRSLRDNISYGRPDATPEQIDEAARKAHAIEFIERLPAGYDTMVGERGIKLSGGQRQRVVIARAMLKDAPILVLDEATSALDSDSERLIQDALWQLMADRTAIVIAHRLSTIQRMDRIVVLADGGVAEQGTHAELLAARGLYAKLWAHQSGGFIED